MYCVVWMFSKRWLILTNYLMYGNFYEYSSSINKCCQQLFTNYKSTWAFHNMISPILNAVISEFFIFEPIRIGMQNQIEKKERQFSDCSKVHDILEFFKIMSLMWNSEIVTTLSEASNRHSLWAPDTLLSCKISHRN